MLGGNVNYNKQRGCQNKSSIFTSNAGGRQNDQSTRTAHARTPARPAAAVPACAMGAAALLVLLLVGAVPVRVDEVEPGELEAELERVDEIETAVEERVTDVDDAVTETVDAFVDGVGSSLVSDGMLVSMVKSEVVASVELALSEMVGIEFGPDEVSVGPSEITEDVTGSVIDSLSACATTDAAREARITAKKVAFMVTI